MPCVNEIRLLYRTGPALTEKNRWGLLRVKRQGRMSEEASDQRFTQSTVKDFR